MKRLRLALPYALRGIRRHPGVAVLLGATVAVAVALAALILGEVSGAAAAFVSRVQPLQLPAPEVAYYASGVAGYPAAQLPTGLGRRLVVAGFPRAPAPGYVIAPAWLVKAAGLAPGDRVAVGTAILRLGTPYRTAWDRTLPILVVAPDTLPLTGKLYAGEEPLPGASWTLTADTGRQLARARLGGVFSPLFWLLGLIAAFGGAGAANAVLLSLLRRRRQFGIVRALGWESGEVSAWIGLEVAVVGVAGVVAGAGLATGAAHWFAARGPLQLNGWDLLAAAALVVGCLALVTRWPLAWMRNHSAAELLRED